MDDQDLEDGEANTDGAVVDSSIEELMNALYARCANQPADKLFTQDDLTNLGVIPNNDVKKLAACVHRLTNKGWIKPLRKDDGTVCWKVVKKEDAAK